MIRRSTVTAVGRAVNAAYFLTTTAYCILSYSSFRPYQFIHPEVFAWPGDFVILHHVLFWLCLLITALTLVPHLRSGRRAVAWATRSYLLVSSAVGVWLVMNRSGDGRLQQSQPGDRAGCLVFPVFSRSSIT